MEELIVIFGIITFTFLIFISGILIGYKEGQVQCINGNIQYELKEQPDKTLEWAEIPSKK